ncbi:MAG: DUF4214 domain-containing protein [Pseudomonadota bacterium]
MALPSFSFFPRAFGPFEPSVTLSGDGRYLAYASFMEGTRQANVFIHDTATGAVRLVSSGLGAPFGANDNYSPVIAGNASALAFTSAAADGVQRIAVADLASGNIVFASTSADGAAANGDSRFASISDDGRYVAFDSAASNLVAGDTNGADDVFVKDMQTGAVRRVSLAAGGAQLDAGAGGAQISADGKSVLFRTMGELFAANLATGAVTLVAPDSAGHAQLSADGRYVAFSSAANLGADSNSHYDVFRKDLLTGSVEQVSTSAASVGASGWSTDPSISADGRYVSFGYDAADLAAGGAPNTNEIYIKDMLTGAVQLASSGAQPGQGSFHSTLSADGAQVAYVRYAGTQGDAFDVSWDVVLAKLAVDAPPATSGTDGNDRFVSGAGNDSWSGGAGLDVAAYHGKLADYTISVGAESVRVTDSMAGRDGADTLAGAERLQFADAMVAVDTTGAGIAGQAYRVYQAAFNRAPDQAGLGYWISVMDKGHSLQAVAQGFVQSAEFAALYGSAPTNAQVVDKLYENVLHRAGDSGGIAYWNSILDNGHANVAAVLASFSDSPENIAALVGVLEHGVQYQPFG